MQEEAWQRLYARLVPLVRRGDHEILQTVD